MCAAHQPRLCRTRKQRRRPASAFRLGWPLPPQSKMLDAYSRSVREQTDITYNLVIKVVRSGVLILESGAVLDDLIMPLSEFEKLHASTLKLDNR